jgi:hypothetical protein
MPFTNHQGDIMEQPLKKIVINTCHGVFGLSHKAFLRLRELGQKDALQEHDTASYWPSGSLPDEPSLNRFGMSVPRDDQKLVAVIEELGAGANGHCACLKVVSIPSDVKWEIQTRHGIELVSEAHRTWN